MLSRFARIPLWAAYLALAALLFVGSFFVPQDHAFPADAILENRGEAALDALKEVSRLVVSLNALLLGAAAAVTVKGREWSARWGRAESTLVMLVFLCGAVTYFGVYIGNIRLLEMVSAGAISPISTGILWALRLQYYGIIIGVILLGLVFTRMLDGVRAPS